MRSVTDKIPGTGVSYNDHWAKTSERVSEIWEVLLRDVIPGPSINKDGTPYTPEELAANPARYFKSYLKNIQDELRLLRAEVKAGHEPDMQRDTALAVDVTQAIGSALLAAVPALAQQIADQVDQLDPNDVRPAVEQAVRNALDSLTESFSVRV